MQVAGNLASRDRYQHAYRVVVIFVQADPDQSTALQLLEDMAQGLTSLHGRGIVHRDLKPQNVLITESGRGKLSDMGMSKRLIPNQSTFITSGAGKLASKLHL